MRSSTSADPSLASLAAEAWDTYLAAHPTQATALGDRRFDDRLPPNAPGEEAALRARLAELVATARDLAAAGSSGDAVTASALVEFLEAEVALRASGVDDWTIDPLDGPQVDLMAIESFHVVDSPRDGAAMLARWAEMGPWLDRHVARLRDSLAVGLVSPSAPVRKSLAAVEALLAAPTSSWAVLRPLAVERPGWSAAQRSRFADGLAAAAELGLRPALERYRAFLADELLPRVRPDERPGLAHLDGGLEAYARLARAHTSLDLPPETIHRIGLEEAARIDDELAALTGRVLGTRDLPEALARLRSDPALHFATGEEIVETAQASLDRAVAAIPAWFGTLPAARCEVAEIPGYEAEHSTIAYYREPAADGSRPGSYYINTTEPTTRPRYEAETLAFHEAVPGHHLQIAIAQELEDLPAFRRLEGPTAYIEGWALYTERLSAEMGLLSGELDRFGILSFDAWRASRLVVDTGMHAMGWSRDRAIAFMVDHTALAENNIANEVDRYLAIPGQALAYKLGQLEMLRLRDRARDALGSRFDIRAFHDVVLGQGAVGLRTLGGIVEAWIAREA